MGKPRTTDTPARRVSVDLDKPSRLHILQTWHNAARMFPGALLRGRISSGGKGVHITADLPDPIPYEAMISARRYLGDDPKRIHYDDVRPDAKPSQILFDLKRGRRAGAWTTDPEHLQRMYRP